MRFKRALQGLVAALAALGAAKTEVLQAKLGVRQSLQSNQRRN